MAIVDMQLFVQTILYFCIFVTGFAISIPVGVTNIYFKGSCMLYGNFKWDNSTHFTMYSSNHTNCNFPIYLGVFGCIFCGLGMGCYNAYALFKSRRETTIASQMWVMPFILTNSLICFSMMISSCIISVGFKSFCTGILKGKIYKKCQDGQNKQWRQLGTDKHFNVKNYYKMMSVAEVASWICVLFWIIQVAFSMIRFFRNRTLRAQGNIGDINKSTTNISTVEPTA